jgi:hypothetical protein
LSAREYVDLSLGPRPDVALPFDHYHKLYHEHSARFDTTSWGYRYFELGVDDREPMEIDGPVGLPGLAEEN